MRRGGGFALAKELPFALSLVALGILGGWQWLAASLLAAAVHEGGHLLVLRLLGAGGGRLRVDAAGFCWQRRGRMLSYGAEVIALLAGPGANLLAALALAHLAAAGVWRGGYFLAGTQLTLGLFNLLPVLPLDGAQVLEDLLSWLLEPVAAARIGMIVSLLTLGMLLALSALTAAVTGAGFLLLGVLGLLGLSLREMGLVKGGGRE